MDFQNLNLLNVRLNMISGNLLPMTADNVSLPILWRMYSMLIWLIQVVQLITFIPGSMYVSRKKFLKDGFLYFVMGAEIFIICGRFHLRRDLINRLIQSINDILSVADDTMKNIVTTTLKPIETSLILYWIVGLISVTMWSCLPFILLLDRDIFYYEDYRMPGVLFRQPIPPRKFILVCIFLLISSVYLFTKKVGIDVYMVHMVTVTTTQYRYIAAKIAMIFRERHEDKRNESWNVDYSECKKKQMKTLCRHHSALIRVTSLLKELLALNFSLIYLSSVMRFCCMGIMMSITSSWERVLIIVYTLGALVQLFILCFCIQQVMDASIEVTDEAFHQEWHLSASSIKNIFMLLTTANNVECKIAKFENFSLSMSSFMTILNQSYTVALLFLKMK